MKRVISLLVLIAMLMTTLAIAIPGFAAEGEDNGSASISMGADESKTGNKMTPGSGTYPAEDGWVGVGTWAELTAALTAGNGASTKIYLKNNIEGATKFSANGGTVSGDNAGLLVGAVIDGNGYSITATGPLFNKINQTTFKNLTLKSTVAVTNGATPFAADWAVGYIKVENVTVEATITPGAVTSDSQQYSGIIMVAQSGSLFKNIYVKSDITLTNSGMSKVNSVGLLAGYTNGTVSFENCIAEGTITIGANAFKDSNTANSGVGGIVGKTSNATSLTDCTSNVAITVTAPASANNKCVGGIVGYSDGITIDNCVNKGNITASATNVSVAGIVAYSNNSTVRNCLNMGVITGANTDKKAPIAIEAEVVNCKYLTSSFVGEAKGEALDTDGLLDLNLKNRKELKTAFAKVAFLLDIDDAEKVANYINYEAVEAAAAEAKDIIEVIDITSELQNEINRVYMELLAAKADMKLTPETKAAVSEAVKSAQAFKENNSNEIYTSGSWNRFVIALAVLKDIDGCNGDPGNAVAALEELDAAMRGLKKDENIVSAVDFAALEGQDGEFHLVSDIEISAPVLSFSGKLYGHGHTITLNGSALFGVLNGAEIYDLDVKGFAADAQSLMGKAVGKVALKGITVDTTALSDAVFFDSAASTAQITVEGAMISTDTEIGALVGDVDCKLSANGIYVDTDAPAFAGTVKSGSTVKNAYIDGKLFADKNGSLTTSATVFASGKVAYEMNKAFEGIASENLALSKINFVQCLGDDALPKLGENASDGTNVVVALLNETTVIGYENAGEKLVDTDFVPAPPVATEKIDYSKLKAAIKKAEALVESKYTPESFAAIAVRLAAAKSALDADTQAEVNSAQKGLLIAIDALEEKAVVAPVADELDYTELMEAIEKAGKLKDDGYTKASWANLEAMLVFANIARRSNDQEEIDEAAANLESAIAALEIFQEDEDVEEESGEGGTPEPEDQGGCGSAIGGAVVALTAVIALAGVSFKKKED